MHKLHNSWIRWVMKLQPLGYDNFLSIAPLRHQRLLSYLSLWEKPRYWKFEGNSGNSDETELWIRIIRASDYAYSTTHTSWINEHSSEPPYSESGEWRGRLGDIERPFLAIGSRLAWRLDSDQKWFFSVNLDKCDGDAEKLTAVCKKHFSNVIDKDGKLYLSSIISKSFHDDAAVLCVLAASAISTEELVSLWMKACALHCELAFIEMLPTWKKDPLINALLEQLSSASSCLDIESDIESELFSRNAGMSSEEIKSHFRRTRMSGRLGSSPNRMGSGQCRVEVEAAEMEQECSA